MSITAEQLAKLPRYARDHIQSLQRTNEDLQRDLDTVTGLNGQGEGKVTAGAFFLRGSRSLQAFVPVGDEQVIFVQEVDEEGKPTSWLKVDADKSNAGIPCVTVTGISVIGTDAVTIAPVASNRIQAF